MISPFFIAVTLAAQPLATASTEMLGIDVPDEFVVGHHQRNGQIEIAELVRPPETVNDWSTLVTSLMFFGAARRGLEAFYTTWHDGIRNKCHGVEGETRRGSVDGHSAMQVVFSCSATASAKAETFTAFVVQGDANILIAQVAFRGEAKPSDAILVERVRKSLKICDQRSFEACEQRKASGFYADR